MDFEDFSCYKENQFDPQDNFQDSNLSSMMSPRSNAPFSSSEQFSPKQLQPKLPLALLSSGLAQLSQNSSSNISLASPRSILSPRSMLASPR